MLGLDDILNGFGSSDLLMLVASLAIGLTNVLKFPLIALPFRDVSNDVLGLTVQQDADPDSPADDAEAAAFEVDVVDQPGPSGRPARPISLAERAAEMAVVLLVVLVCAIALQKLALGFQIIGPSQSFTSTMNRHATRAHVACVDRLAFVTIHPP